MINCDSGASSVPCTNPAEYKNQNGVCVCPYHKLLLDAFTWEDRNKRHWVKLTKADETFEARYKRIKARDLAH